MKISVRSIPDSFRRAKMAFTKVPKEHDVDEKTYKILKAEPMLVVEIVPETAATDEISAMTVPQLTEAISTFRPVESLKGLKKAELIEILKAKQKLDGPKE